MGFESDLWDHGPMQIAAYPSELHPSIAQALLSGGIATKLIDNPDIIRQPGEWSAVLVDATVDVERRIREANRFGQDTGVPVVVVIESTDLWALHTASDIADFVLLPLNPEELAERLTRVSSEPEPAVVLGHGDLVLNTATYQATLDGDPIDLTFMEYELLRYFVEHPGRVWSREQLLSAVWGYDYFGGSRTVDVHVRRLRSKLGEERASWISTVRSVGYRFG